MFYFQFGPALSTIQATETTDLYPLVFLFKMSLRHDKRLNKGWACLDRSNMSIDSCQGSPLGQGVKDARQCAWTPMPPPGRSRAPQPLFPIS